MNYLDHFNLIWDVSISMHYILNVEYTTIQKKLSSKEYIKKYLEYQKVMSNLANEQGGTGIYLSDEHKKIHDLQNRFRDNVPKSYHLMNMTLVYLIALLEGFNKQFFKLLFSEKPELPKINIKSNIVKICKNLESNFNISLKKEFNNWESLRENYCRRNIIVHNRGKIDEEYLEKTTNRSPDLLGSTLNCDIEYTTEANNNIKSYMEFLFNKIKEKFNLDDSVLRFAPFPPDFDKSMIVKKTKEEIIDQDE